MYRCRQASRICRRKEADVPCLSIETGAVAAAVVVRPAEAGAALLLRCCGCVEAVAALTGRYCCPRGPDGSVMVPRGPHAQGRPAEMKRLSKRMTTVLVGSEEQNQ